MTHTAKCILGTTSPAVYLYLVSLTPITGLQYSEHYCKKTLKEQVYITKSQGPCSYPCTCSWLLPLLSQTLWNKHLSLYGWMQLVPSVEHHSGHHYCQPWSITTGPRGTVEDTKTPCSHCRYPTGSLSIVDNCRYCENCWSELITLDFFLLRAGATACLCT